METTLASVEELVGNCFGLNTEKKKKNERTITILFCLRILLLFNGKCVATVFQKTLLQQQRAKCRFGPPLDTTNGYYGNKSFFSCEKSLMKSAFDFE